MQYFCSFIRLWLLKKFFFPARTSSIYKLNIVTLTWILQGNLIHSGGNILRVFNSFPPASFIGVMIKNRFHFPFQEERWNQSKCRWIKLDFKVWKVLVKNKNKNKNETKQYVVLTTFFDGSDRMPTTSKYVFDLGIPTF